MWTCPAIDHGVTIFPNGKIGPCCQIEADYLKPISELPNPDRFADLKTTEPPAACIKCRRLEHDHLPSYRRMFEKYATPAPGIQFLDVRNSNHCNLKCRYCGPHFSSSWANELAQKMVPIEHQDIQAYKKYFISDSLHWVYFTGGEPLILPDHWELLEELSQRPNAKSIELLYNSNLTTIRYKDRDVADLWSRFKSVTVQCSIDAIGPVFERIRSGASWSRVEQNLFALQAQGINLRLMPVISLLSIWFLDELVAFAQQHSLSLAPVVLHGPDYLALNAVPTGELKELALQKIECLKESNPNEWYQLIQMISNNNNEELFKQTIGHVLLLDELRNEKLFELLPFKNYAIEHVLKNHEYK